ncbi:ATP-binding protein [Luteimonas abyssi]|uniref:ATP-binding protein n=1 Tax=Luteimonas abyssi TaxID=1247514 RepID=UPI0009EB3D7C|nr:sensor histidine kinase [Luteimonas abyssi]
MPDAATSLVRSLHTLRWIAAACLVLAMLFGVHHLHLHLPGAPLWGAIVLLTSFNVGVGLRLRRRTEATAAEAFAHVLVDTAVLAWVVAWSGGIANPFASLFLLPVALAALALPAPWAVASGVASVSGYLFAVTLARPLPHMHGDGLDLHLSGMAINFLLSVVLVVYFLVRLASARDARERELAMLRERFARDEGIVALATHAASVAHELNTPLATMGLLLEELEAGELSPEAAADVATLRQLVETSGRRVRALADPADPAHQAPVALERLLQHWTLIRPTVDFVQTGRLPAGLGVDRALGHLLLVLLNNAADASDAAGMPRVELALAFEAGTLNGTVRDHGPGFDTQAPFLPIQFRTTKANGMGVGLALSHATLERLGGTLSVEDAPGGGTIVRFCLPLGDGAQAPNGAAR